MGRASAGDRFFIDLSCAVATVAAETVNVATITAAEYSASFLRGLIFAQASLVQADAHVRGGEINQRRRQLVEPHGARLSLLVATAADGFWVVGG